MIHNTKYSIIHKCFRYESAHINLKKTALDICSSVLSIFVHHSYYGGPLLKKDAIHYVVSSR